GERRRPRRRDPRAPGPGGDALRPQPRRHQPLAAGADGRPPARPGLPGIARRSAGDPGLNSSVELRRVSGEMGGRPPPDYLVEELRYPGGDEVLGRTREVMPAVLSGEELPGWVVAQCVDDTELLTCELKSWSLRAWKY